MTRRPAAALPDASSKISTPLPLQSVRLHRGQTCMVQVSQGSVWATFDAEEAAGDHILSKGQSLCFTGPGLLVVEAMEKGAQFQLSSTE